MWKCVRRTVKSQEHIVGHPADRRGCRRRLVEWIGSPRRLADEMGCRGRPVDVRGREPKGGYLGGCGTERG